jgi:NitT/TauT family transport system substrate-binding protein
MTDESVPTNPARRSFLAYSSAVLTAPLLAAVPKLAGADVRPETAGVRIVRSASICVAPQYVAEELLRAEGFLKVEYVERPPAMSYPDVLAAGGGDFTLASVELITAIEAGRPLAILAGVHAGCWELFGNDRVRSIRDLKGKSVAVSAMFSAEHIFIAGIAAYVGIDPQKDIHWVAAGTYAASMALFVDGKVDALLAFPPQPQDLREGGINKVIVNTARDRPWSQYFCCMVAARRGYVERYPAATKCVLRALLKAIDICAEDPEQVARLLAAKGYQRRQQVVLEVLRGLPYNRWRTDDPTDTLRFHSLRLREAGMIRSTPQQIIDRGSDFRFLNELKKELKA